MPKLISEIFPVRSHSAGLPIGYSIDVTIFGGFAPTNVETFIHLTGNKLATNYVLRAAVLSGVSLAIVAVLMCRLHSRRASKHR
jgi:MHS family proline/betaine transporter-like MFS transporter